VEFAIAVAQDLLFGIVVPQSPMNDVNVECCVDIGSRFVFRLHFAFALKKRNKIS
jgi:hypothetical protein